MNNKKKTHFKGLIGELKFAIHLLNQGWQVFKPLDQNSRVDYVLEKDGIFKRIQVKYCSTYKGCLRIELEHPHRKTGPYQANEVDEIGVYNPNQDKYYLIPLDKFGSSKEIWFRLEAPKADRGYKIKWAVDYEV